MSKVLSTFMIIGAIMLFLSTVYYGLTYQTLHDKQQQDVEVSDKYQIQPS